MLDLGIPGLLLIPVVQLLVIIGIIYVVISLITRRVSRSIEQSEARVTASIAQSEARIAASIKKAETE